jgi:hypothetical protein
MARLGLERKKKTRQKTRTKSISIIKFVNI